MVIHHDELPFKVCFFQTMYKDNKIIREDKNVIEYFSDSGEQYLPIITEIKEMIDTSVILQINEEERHLSDSKLYIDGIDVLDKVVVSEDDIYIPSGVPVSIYIQRENDRSYPWIPGVYRVIVKCNGIKYYSYVNVTPLHIEENELEILRKDIENISGGLAREIVFKRKGVVYDGEINSFKRFNSSIATGGEAFLKNRQWALEEIQKIKNDSYQYISFIKSVLKTDLFDSISKPTNLSIPMILIRENRYRFLYNIYRSFTDNIQIVPKGIFELQWKATDKLYEYWCFIKLITVLKEMEYEPLGGWIFDKLTNKNKFSVFIEDGTTVEMVKQNCRLLLIFNKEIPLEKSYAIKYGEYIWSKLGNNKPDIRIDVFIDNCYKHSVVIDAKYRNPDRVWNKRKTKEYRRPATMIQLSNYKMAFENPAVPDKPVVKRVFAFCPRPVKDKSYDEDNDHGITVTLFKPLSDYAHIKELLAKNIVVTC